MIKLDNAVILNYNGKFPFETLFTIDVQGKYEDNESRQIYDCLTELSKLKKGKKILRKYGINLTPEHETFETISEALDKMAKVACHG